MALFPAGFIDDLKSHADIVQVVQERGVQLRRSGTAWKGLCPFHGEKTPSFQVHGERGFFHCFGCGVGGDVIKFIELFDKVAFPEAVRQLAGRFGLTVPESADSSKNVPGRLAASLRYADSGVSLSASTLRVTGTTRCSAASWRKSSREVVAARWACTAPSSQTGCWASGQPSRASHPCATTPAGVACPP